MTEVAVTVNKPVVSVTSPTSAVVNVSTVHDKIVLNKFDPAYLAIFDTTTQTDGAGTTTSRITFNNTYLNYDFSFNGSTVTFLRDGTFNIQYSAQWENASSQIQDTNLFTKVNGQIAPETSTYCSVPNKHGAVNGNAVTAVNYIGQFHKNDTLEFWWYSTSTDVKLHTIPERTTTPVMPRSPAIIVTIAQIS